MAEGFKPASSSMAAARQASLISLFVALVIGISATVKPPFQEDRALQELRYLGEILDLWYNEIEGKPIQVVEGLHEGGYPYTPQTTTIFELVGARELGETDPAKMVTCTTEPWVRPGNAALATRVGNSPFGLGSAKAYGYDGKTWRSGDRPTDLASVRAFWNRLHHANIAFKEPLAEPNGALFELYLQDIPIVAVFEAAESLSLISFEEIRSTREDIPSLGSSVSDLVSNLPTQSNAFETQESLACTSVSHNIELLPDHVEFLAKLTFNYRVWETDWIKKWTSFARKRGITMSDNPRPRGAFDQAFPSLATQAKGLETIALDDLGSWLLSRLDESSNSVSISGISAPYEMVKALGISVIAFFQFYAWAHVRGATARMQWAPDSLEAASLPWLAIQAPPTSYFAQALIVGLPVLLALHAFVIFWGFHVSVSPALHSLNGLGVAASLLAATILLRDLTILRRVSLSILEEARQP